MTTWRSGVLKLIDSLGYRIERKTGAEPGSLPPDFSQEVARTVNAVRGFTMTSPERICSLVDAVEYIVRNKVPGEIVECGVWKGGSMMAIALTLLRLRAADRRLYLFDTFDGMPPASDVDRDLHGAGAEQLLDATKKSSEALIWAMAQIEEVRKNMGSTDYPPGLVDYVEGRVEETIPSKAPQRISLLRLDTDWFESTKHELVHLFPRLSEGGVLIIDDYGHWQGARKAVDEYIATSGVPILLCRIDYTGRIAIKQSRIAAAG